jgi:hypothetical protein
LLPFFGLAALMIVLFKKQYRQLPGVLLGLFGPQLIVLGLLKVFFKIDFHNSNTDAYFNVLYSYLHPPDLEHWLPVLKDLHVVTFNNFFFSNFLFLPLLFLLLWLLQWFAMRVPMHRAVKAVLLAVALVFLFNNLAPPYTGWPLRGSWIPRLYQPVFVVMLLYSVQVLQAVTASRSSVKAAGLLLFCATLIGNAAISFGPVFNSSFTAEIYHRFYRHASPQSMTDNLTRYGRRPLGLCSEAFPIKQ